MPKEVVATRVEPDFKEKIEQEASKKDREPAWMVRKLLELGWEAYNKKNAKARAA